MRKKLASGLKYNILRFRHRFWHLTDFTLNLESDSYQLCSGPLNFIFSFLIHIVKILILLWVLVKISEIMHVKKY